MLLFESDQLDETEQFLRATYAPMRIGSTTPGARARIARTVSDQISVDRVGFDFEMTYDVEPLGRIGLADVTSGALEDHAPDGGDRASYGPGELFALSAPDRPYTGTAQRATYTVTMIDQALLGEVALPAGRASTVELLDLRPVDAAAAGRLRAAINHLDEVVLSDPVVAGSPLVVGAAARYVAAHVLAAFRNTAMGGGTVGDSRDAHPATLRRAIEHIEANAHRDLSPAQIAAAAHVSIRALQIAFRRHLDTTPMGYLREVRLTRAHRDLAAASGAQGDLVADIAARWGFVHQGHFGQSYRRAYGETPGTTLRRG